MGLEILYENSSLKFGVKLIETTIYGLRSRNYEFGDVW